MSPIDGGVRFQTREQAAADAQVKFRDNPDALKYMTAENLLESFHATSKSRGFTCTGVIPIRELPAVDKLFVAGCRAATSPARRSRAQDMRFP